MPRVRGALLLGTLLAIAPLRVNGEAPPGSLAAFFASQGFDRIHLQRRFGNQLYFTTLINGRPGKLIIDNSAPTTLIHRESAVTYGLSLSPTNRRVSNMWGGLAETYSTSRLRSLQIGSRTLTDIPIAVADAATWLNPPEYMIVPKLIPRSKKRDLRFYVHVEDVNGLLGAELLQKVGAVVDCGHQMLYTNPAGPSASTSEKLAAILAYRGFTRIPMRLTRDHQFEVEVGINGHPTRLLVNTGAPFTFLGREASGTAHVFSKPLRLLYELPNRSLASLNGAAIKDLRIGDFIVHYSDVTVADVSNDTLRPNSSEEANSGLLGMEVLSLNFAMLDFGNMTLYMRRPDRK